MVLQFTTFHLSGAITVHGSMLRLIVIKKDTYFEEIKTASETNYGKTFLHVYCFL